MTEGLHPTLVYTLGAALLPLLRGRVRQVAALLVPTWACFNVFQLQSGVHWTVSFLEFEFVLGRIDAWTGIFLHVFTLLSWVGILYVLRDNDPLDLSGGLLYAGCAMGVVLAGDLVSLFVFWEMLTLGAVLCILARRSGASRAAAFRYLLVHVFGGVVLLAGIVLHLSNTGSAAFGRIELGSPASYLIFLGFGINCAWPILGAWLPDTYPEASVGGILFMATYTTKTAVYVLARSFPGEPALIWIGAAMAILPLFHAVIENDLRRVLAYTLINQVGFMVVGIGLGTSLALNGTAAHAYCHILYKALLFMAIGAVLYRTGTAKATELGGLARSMPVTCAFCCLGAASMATPFLCGFVGKSFLTGAVAKEGLGLLWLLLLAASAGGFLMAAIKVPFFAFFSRDSGLRPREAPRNMLAAMAIVAVFCVITGAFPDRFLSEMLPNADATYQPYTVGHVVDQFSLLLFSGLAFALLLLAGLYPAEMRATNLDADWLWRKGGRAFDAVMDRTLNGANRLAADVLAGKLIPALRQFLETLPWNLSHGILVILGRSAKPGSPRGAPGFRDQARNGALPIGLTACLAVFFLALLFIL